MFMDQGPHEISATLYSEFVVSEGCMGNVLYVVKNSGTVPCYTESGGVLGIKTMFHLA